MNMKNLVQGQEISSFKEIRGLSISRFFENETKSDFSSGCFGFIVIIIFFTTCIIIEDFVYEYFKSFFEKEKNFFFGILRIILFFLSGVLPLGLLLYIFSSFKYLRRLYY